MYNAADIDDWALMGSVWTPIAATVVYILLLKIASYFGKDEWENAGKKVLTWFYVIMSSLYFFIFIRIMYLNKTLEYSVACQPPPQSLMRLQTESKGFFDRWVWKSDEEEDSEDNVKRLEFSMAKMLWLYMASKIMEFFDPIVYALMRYPISINDTVHHIFMCIFAWLGVKYYPGGSTSIWVTISVTYLLVAYLYQTFRRVSHDPDGPYWQRTREFVYNLKYTHLVAAMIHCATVICYDCGYPRWVAALLFVSIAILIYASSTFGRRPPVDNQLRREDNLAEEMSNDENEEDELQENNSD